MILHTINALPTSTGFRDCLKLLQPHDAVVLLGEGVYAATDGTEALAALITTGVDIFVLGRDASAAGIRPAVSIATIDMDDLVGLTVKYSRQLAWY